MGNMDMSHMDMGHGGHDMSGMNMSGGGMMMMHGGHMMNMGNLKHKFWGSFALMIPILIMSPMMGMRLPFQFFFKGSDWIVAILGTILFFYGGKPFFSGAKGELEAKQPAMMSLISMGISVAYVYSIYSVIHNNLTNSGTMVSNFFWELSTLIVIMLLGHWIEMNTIMNAGSAVDKLSNLLPNTASVKQSDGSFKSVSLTDLHNGDMVLVKAGEKIPADGIITDGSGKVNESLVTGESRSVEKNVNDKVIGGSTNDDGSIQFKVTGTGDSGYLSKVKDLVSSAQNSKSKNQNLADKVSGYLFYASLSIAIVAWLIWSLVSGVSFATTTAVTVLIIACPHALGLAIPLVVSRTTSLAATNGLLIRNRDALEGTKKLKYALMDKTGTLTQGQFKVNLVKSLSDQLSDDDALKLIASAEQTSSHPLASGILAAAKAKNLQLETAENVKQITGAGLEANINGKQYQVVSSKYLTENQIDFDEQKFNQVASQGNTVSYLTADGKALALVAEGDQIKPDSDKMVKYLISQGIQPVMLTGDNQQTADKVAKTLGITKVEANLKPEDKQKLVTKYQQAGAVMFIGDGVNDAPSLAKANLGVAIGSGTDVAIDSADVVLVNSDPKDVIALLKLARSSENKMVENLWWGAGYNIIALPLAAGILAFAGIILSPMVGAILMSLSTVIVAINAMTLHIEK
ncbi:heavy metal translocating P-type ATPase [Lactobacillus sp. Sy-1]|uniref:heavy metal translocating P-type ATPase n=1 Tax=Lactobacillus sp. Sy-1 TaxID=2109645 RepID=UPI001C5B6E79|nr:heavy metal translocating P-type ATPase [Lactobacillus sp. Sy-1]MBW1605069.1 copper-translocating P-type ATPase [Lactobacillus sp. Sy-1]